MTHFDLALWLDFARGTLPKEQESQMAEHLHGGCRECEAAVEFFKRTVDAAEGLHIEVPPDVVQKAEAIAEKARRQSEQDAPSPSSLDSDPS